MTFAGWDRLQKGFISFFPKCQNCHDRRIVEFGIEAFQQIGFDLREGKFLFYPLEFRSLNDLVRFQLGFREGVEGRDVL